MKHAKRKTFEEIWNEELKNPTPPTPEQKRWAKAVVAHWDAVAKATKGLFDISKK